LTNKKEFLRWKEAPFMDRKAIVGNFWKIMDLQQWDNLANYLSEEIQVYWPNTNEVFNGMRNFIRANSEYPGNWKISVVKLMEIDDEVISVVEVHLDEASITFYATSFFKFVEDRIIKLTEYWGEVGEMPQWRKELGISDIIGT